MKKKKLRQQYPYFIRVKDESGTTLLRTISKRLFIHRSARFIPETYHLSVAYIKTKGYSGRPTNEAECKNKTELQYYVSLFTEANLLRDIYC